jgi:molecular chaperone HtpG
MSDIVSDKMTQSTESLEYRTEVKQLLDILAHSLYTDREIFLRELISNASDALNRIQFEMLTNHDVVDSDAELAIHVVVDAEAKTITIRDSGVGMNHGELIENLGTIAHSGAKTFLLNAGKGLTAQEEIIGQFGVGFYSVFMVAEEVTVTSRSYRPEDSAWTWTSRGDSKFTLTPAEKNSRGTEIVIKLKEDAGEFAAVWRIENIVKKHSDYVSFPIYVRDATASDNDAKVANRRTALWRQSPSQVETAEYEEFYKQLTFDSAAPLLHIHLVTDAPVNLRAILFIPPQRERGMLHLRADYGLRLYSRKILIQQHNKDLLPEYLRFVDGVVDSEDLPLNVSRETVQSNPLMRQIRRALTGRLHKELKSLAENDAGKYAQFWEQFGVFLKEGIAMDPTSHETLVDLLRFRSSRTNEQEWTSLKQYTERMVEGQKAIYYVLGQDLKTVAASPHLDYFRANQIEVLYLVDPIDGFVTSSLHKYGETPLQNVDDASLELPKSKEPEQPAAEITPEEFDEVVKRFIGVLGERVKTVRESKILVNSPCRLVSPEDSFDRDLQRFRRMTEEDYEIPKKVLEINRRHPIIVNLAKTIEHTPTDPLIPAAIEQLFDNALLLEGLHANPVAMVERIQSILAAAVEAKAR